MLKVKKTITHDWMRIAVKEGSINVSLTWSRYRDTVSASIDTDRTMLRKLGELWSGIRNIKSGKTLGQRLDLIEEKAKTCTSIAEFITRLEDVLNSLK